LKNWVRIN